jgi:hypothetical protein
VGEWRKRRKWRKWRLELEVRLGLGQEARQRQELKPDLGREQGREATTGLTLMLAR